MYFLQKLCMMYKTVIHICCVEYSVFMKICYKLLDQDGFPKKVYF